MKRTLLALGTIVLAVGIGACNAENKDTKPVTVSSYKEYTDRDMQFTVSYPDGWVMSIAGSRAVFYSRPEIAEGFSTFEPKGQTGGKIEVHAQPGDAALVEQNINDIRGLFTDASAVKAPTQTTVNGLPATMISYSANLGGDVITAERYYIVTDSVMTYLETAVIGNYDDYKSVFETVRKNFQPGRRATASATPGDTAAAAPPAAKTDSVVTDPPSSEMKTYSGASFSMSYPANFDATSGGDGTIFSGARADSRVQVNKYDSKGVALDQIVEASKKNYGGRAATKTTVGGQPAYVFTFGSGAASGRAYYVVSGKSLFVISTSWYTPQSDLYRPAFEKMIASFRPKG